MAPDSLAIISPPYLSSIFGEGLCESLRHLHFLIRFLRRDILITIEVASRSLEANSRSNAEEPNGFAPLDGTLVGFSFSQILHMGSSSYKLPWPNILAAAALWLC